MNRPPHEVSRDQQILFAVEESISEAARVLRRAREMDPPRYARDIRSLEARAVHLARRILEGARR